MHLHKTTNLFSLSSLIHAAPGSPVTDGITEQNKYLSSSSCEYKITFCNTIKSGCLDSLCWKRTDGSSRRFLQIQLWWSIFLHVVIAPHLCKSDFLTCLPFKKKKTNWGNTVWTHWYEDCCVSVCTAVIMKQKLCLHVNVFVTHCLFLHKCHVIQLLEQCFKKTNPSV